MKVKELIERLQECMPEAKVFIEYYSIARPLDRIEEPYFYKECKEIYLISDADE